jgi:hypothetical protein
MPPPESLPIGRLGANRLLFKGSPFDVMQLAILPLVGIILAQFPPEQWSSQTPNRITVTPNHLDTQLLRFAQPLLLPDYPTFNSQRLDQQLESYARYLATSGIPDVLIVGSSRSLQGVDPVALETALADQGYPGIKIYNFSINGATAKVIDLIVRRILTPEQLPRLILWADGSRAFNSGRVDITYNGIATSEGYKRLATGVRPIANLEPVETSPELHAICFDLPKSIPTKKVTLPSSEMLDTLVSEVVRQSYTNFVCEQSWALEHVEPDPTTSTVNITTSPSPTVNGLETAGFQPVAMRFDPATYYQQFPRVSGQYDSNYVPFQLPGEQMNATIAIARYMRHQQIPLVFVNLPLTQEYLDPVRQNYEQQFQQHMQQLASQEGFIYRDLLWRWATENGFFADPSHLNRYGAEAVSMQLALDPVIPWAILQAAD